MFRINRVVYIIKSNANNSFKYYNLCGNITAYEASTNADDMVLLLINVNVTSQNYQISVKFIVEVLN